MDFEFRRRSKKHPTIFTGKTSYTRAQWVSWNLAHICTARVRTILTLKLVKYVPARLAKYQEGRKRVISGVIVPG